MHVLHVSELVHVGDENERWWIGASVAYGERGVSEGCCPRFSAVVQLPIKRDERPIRHIAISGLPARG